MSQKQSIEKEAAKRDAILGMYLFCENNIEYMKKTLKELADVRADVLRYVYECNTLENEYGDKRP